MFLGVWFAEKENSNEKNFFSKKMKE